MHEAKLLVDFIEEKKPESEFYSTFEGKYSEGFDLKKDLEKIGVVNQTTMLASETEEISNFLKQFIIDKRGQEITKTFLLTLEIRFVMLQTKIKKLLTVYWKYPLTWLLLWVVTIVLTPHLVELCEKVLPTYFVKSEEEIFLKKQ